MFDPIKRMLNMQEANSERSAVHCYSATYLDPQSDLLAMFDKMFRMEIGTYDKYSIPR